MVLNEIRIIQEIFDNNSQIIPEGDRLIGLNALMRINNMLQQRTDNMLQQQTDNRIIQLTENDLHKFGYHTHANYDDDDEANRGTVFVCSHHTFQLEEILIRSILAPLNYEIREIDYDHVVPDQDACDVRFITNYPWFRYYNGPIPIQLTENIPIQLTENDLHKFGYHTHANYDDDDEANRGTVFVCSHHTFQLEEILIRSILAPLNYEIREIDYDHVVPDQDACDVRFITNYPWSRYYNGPMTTTMYSIQLTENDLHQFGYCKHANYDEDANRGTVFVCSHHTFELEEILIRSILAPLNCEIREIDYDHVPNQDACDVRFITNYPWIRYCP